MPGSPSSERAPIAPEAEPIDAVDAPWAAKVCKREGVRRFMLAGLSDLQVLLSLRCDEPFPGTLGYAAGFEESQGIHVFVGPPGACIGEARLSLPTADSLT
jgi:hypothetical protein